ncbi:MAG: DUF4399 domain-containing protein [SAR86 cluster bacterium]|uniref:DUF4399 domain-containing protein n=1 Tax=SAR86 cluster bacterium TaxID=2030880 RepID=A0A520MVM7_9GAMM|nr:MAG: DUF4399 domain-containing protein [SAR86 cluster bacterium]|tara:strand:+ start:282 stop:746 length:465 start_codon:yes stop_codon:yes gene_type:complete
MKHILYILLVSPLVFSLDTIDNCDDIELFFKSPQDGLIIENQKFKVEFGTKNINISPAGVIVEQTNNCLVSGHHHLIINDAYDVRNFENQPIPYDTNILHFGGGQKEAELTLQPGKYSLQLVIGNYQHMPISRTGSGKKYNPIVSKIINIEIKP